jgi:hypothetical protein
MRPNRPSQAGQRLTVPSRSCSELLRIVVSSSSRVDGSGFRSVFAVAFSATAGPIDSDTKRTRLLPPSYSGECWILRKGRESYTQGYNALTFAPTAAPQWLHVLTHGSGAVNLVLGARPRVFRRLHE